MGDNTGKKLNINTVIRTVVKISINVNFSLVSHFLNLILFTTMHGLHFSGSMMLKLPIQTI